MTTKTLTSVQAAAAQLLDAILTGTDVALDVSFAEPNMSALEQLMTALHEEARHRGVGVTIEPKEGRTLCLSLHHP